ncbi:MAG: 2,3-bisphosphoglycerate-independent phosphoglycerate mutase [Phycisphaerales bacterium]|nr:MAG: 2,3-bisphosphoglycerate-independent phosphoglycerate mutase [Phycisphaerales bacterium]
MSKPRNTPCVLIIRDGWGENPHALHDAFNAIKLANTPVADRLMAEWPHALIGTSGEDVGLPEGTMGNSEVGHQNIGAGRVVDQEAVRISKACRAGLSGNETLAEAIRGARDAGRNVHLMGINSDAGVHGLLEHLYALLRLCKALDVPPDRVFVHLFTDGRDTGPFTGKAFAETVVERCREMGVGRVASIIGRYWAMDRDNRWERVRRAYDCLTGRGDCPRFASPGEAIQRCYDHPGGSADAPLVGDEFIEPSWIAETEEAASASRVRDGDAVVFYNYRGDRPREICSAFLLPEFHGADEVKPSPDSGERGFDRGPKLNLRFVLMSPYSERLAQLAGVAFPRPPKMTDIGGAYFSKLGLKQFRCAETEKFPHVTFFFNDYRDEPFPGERREIIQSPQVATYDLKPEMSSDGVRDAVLRRLASDDCEDVIVVNFANGDMVGHTGSLQAAIRACEVVDACVGAIADATLSRGGSVIVTADHGNAEQMRDPETSIPHTAHTTYPVPCIVVGEPFRGRRLRTGGRLGDLVPTMLEMMGIPQPSAMTGKSLLAPKRGE